MSSKHRRACACCLQEGGSAYKLSARACRAALVAIRPHLQEGTALARGFSPFTRGFDATCQLQSRVPNRRPRVKQAQARVRSVSPGRRRTTRGCCARDRAALVVAGPSPIRGHHTSERPLSIGTWPWCDVPDVTSVVKPMPACKASAGGPALAVSGEVAQHTSLLRALATLRRLWVIQAP